MSSTDPDSPYVGRMLDAAARLGDQNAEPVEEWFERVRDSLRRERHRSS
jgi:hypothetical protein